MIELCRLFDGKLSVRLDGREVCILPDKPECTDDDLLGAFQKVALVVRANVCPECEASW